MPKQTTTVPPLYCDRAGLAGFVVLVRLARSWSGFGRASATCPQKWKSTVTTSSRPPFLGRAATERRRAGPDRRRALIPLPGTRPLGPDGRVGAARQGARHVDQGDDRRGRRDPGRPRRGGRARRPRPRGAGAGAAATASSTAASGCRPGIPGRAARRRPLPVRWPRRRGPCASRPIRHVRDEARAEDDSEAGDEAGHRSRPP